MIPRRLLRLAMRVKGLVVASALAILLVSVTYLATAFATAQALAAVATDDLPGAMKWIAVAAATVALRAIAIPIRAAIATAAGRAVRRTLRADLLTHTVALGPAWASGQRLGEAQTTIVEGVDGLDPYYTDYLPQLMVTALLPPAIVVGVATIHPPSAVFLGLCLAVTLIVPRFKDASLVRQGSARWQSYLELSSDYLEAMQGVATLRSFGAARRRRDALEERSDAVYRATMRPLRTSLLENGVTMGFTLLGTAGAVLLATIAVNDGDRRPLDALLVLLLSVECFRPVRDLSKAWHSGYLGLTASGGVDQILRAKPQVPDDGKDELRLDGPPAVELDGVSYTYPGSNRPALRNVSLHLPAGTLTAIVGPSGAGKSTLAGLLSRRVDPDEGSVRIDATDLRHVSLTSLRDQLATVPQRTYLFTDTIAANLRLGAPDVADDELREALRQAQANEFVSELPDGLLTTLTEGGNSLSGGERQRLALARALARRTPLLLLDEPTSNVDPEADADIMGALGALAGDRTVIVIAHRLDSIMRAGHVVVLVDGDVVEQGTPDELAASGGAFASLRTDERRARRTEASNQEASSTHAP